MPRGESEPIAATATAQPSAGLGLSIPFPQDRVFYLYVRWTRGSQYRNDENCSAVASLGLSNVAAAQQLGDALRNPSAGRARQKSYYVWVEESLTTPEEFVNIESQFISLIDQWVTYSTAVGGLAQYLT